jgi:RNA polymerase sigma-70 factor (ECF subfamily)
VEESLVDTFHIHQWLDRIKQGDLSAREEMLRGICGRLEKLAKKMVKNFPNVHRWVDTEDVLQNATMRLLKSLQAIRPESTRAFFGLAAEHIRRELLDLARHYYGPLGIGSNHDSVLLMNGQPHPAHDPPEVVDDAADLDRWHSFHEAVARLPKNEREVMDLIFYHGWTQTRVAELLQVHERTVRRYWHSALLSLQHMVAEEA